MHGSLTVFSMKYFVTFTFKQLIKDIGTTDP